MIIFVTYDSQQFQMYVWKTLISSFLWISNAQKSGKTPQNSKNHQFSHSFGDKLINWNMKNQTRHTDILARQSKTFLYQLVWESVVFGSS